MVSKEFIAALKARVLAAIDRGHIDYTIDVLTLMDLIVMAERKSN